MGLRSVRVILALGALILVATSAGSAIPLHADPPVRTVPYSLGSASDGADSLTHPQDTGGLELISHIGDDWISRGVAVQRGYVYVGTAYGLAIVDVHNPAAPEQVGYYAPQDLAHSQAVAVYDNYVYSFTYRLRVIDVSNPHNPQEAGSVDVGVNHKFSIAGHYLYVAGHTGYPAFDPWLRIFDISDPRHPDQVWFSDIDADDVAVIGTYAYVAGSAGLYILDVSDPAHPTEIGACETPGHVFGMAVQGGHAWVAGGSRGLTVIDVSDPRNPFEIAYVDINSAMDVDTDGHYAYVAKLMDGTLPANEGVIVFDIADPRNLVQVAYYPIQWTVPWTDPWELVVQNGYVYLATEESGLFILRYRLTLELPLDTAPELTFGQGFRQCTTSLLDHQYPNEKGASGDQNLFPYTGVPISDTLGAPCQYGLSCYDGHEGYDFDDAGDCGTLAVAAAPGEIISSESGCGKTYGCQVVVEHFGGYRTLYGHLRVETPVTSGRVATGEYLGTIGDTGISYGTHLHFGVYHNSVEVDPSGWLGSGEDPWEVRSGAESVYMWSDIIQTRSTLDATAGGSLISPSGDVAISIPAGAHTDTLTFDLAEVPVADPSAQLRSTGHSFSLHAVDSLGDPVTAFDLPLTVTVTFSREDLRGIKSGTLALYIWDNASSSWQPLATDVDEAGGQALAQISHLSYFALMGERQYEAYLPLALREY